MSGAGGGVSGSSRCKEAAMLLAFAIISLLGRVRLTPASFAASAAAPIFSFCSLRKRSEFALNLFD